MVKIKKNTANVLLSVIVLIVIMSLITHAILSMNRSFLKMSYNSLQYSLDKIVMLNDLQKKLAFINVNKKKTDLNNIFIPDELFFGCKTGIIVEKIKLNNNELIVGKRIN